MTTRGCNVKSDKGDYPLNKEEHIRKAYKLGFDYEKEYRGCSQCAIAAVQDALGVRNDFVFKAGSGLATGIGLLRDGVCGGYSGGVMVMSTFFGKIRQKFDGDRDEKYCSFNMAVNLHEKFIKKYGTVICEKIHYKIFGETYDLWIPEEKEAFENSGAHKDKCTSVVANAAAWTVEIILDEIKKRGLNLNHYNKLKYHGVL